MTLTVNTWRHNISYVKSVCSNLHKVIFTDKVYILKWIGGIVACGSFLLFMFYVCHAACADPEIFVRGGGPGQSDRKKPWQRFFLVLSLFYRSQMTNFKEIYHFWRGPTFSGGGGGPTFSRGGSNCLFPLETHITSDFPGEVRTTCPPLDPHSHCILVVICWERANLLALLYVMFSCVLSLTHVLSMVRCSTLVYQFLIFAFFPTLNRKKT